MSRKRELNRVAVDQKVGHGVGTTILDVPDRIRDLIFAFLSIAELVAS